MKVAYILKGETIFESGDDKVSKGDTLKYKGKIFIVDRLLFKTRHDCIGDTTNTLSKVYLSPIFHHYSSEGVVWDDVEVGEKVCLVDKPLYTLDHLPRDGGTYNNLLKISDNKVEYTSFNVLGRMIQTIEDDQLQEILQTWRIK